MFLCVHLHLLFKGILVGFQKFSVFESCVNGAKVLKFICFKCFVHDFRVLFKGCFTKKHFLFKKHRFIKENVTIFFQQKWNRMKFWFYRLKWSFSWKSYKFKFYNSITYFMTNFLWNHRVRPMNFSVHREIHVLFFSVRISESEIFSKNMKLNEILVLSP